MARGLNKAQSATPPVANISGKANFESIITPSEKVSSMNIGAKADIDITNCAECAEAFTGVISRYTSDGEGKRLAPWGGDNMLPYTLLKAITNDPQALQTLKAKINYLLGTSRIQCYKFDENNTAKRLFVKEADEWLKANRLALNTALELIAHNFVALGNAFVVISVNRKGEIDFQAIDAVDVRAQYPPEKEFTPKEYTIFYNTAEPGAMVHAETIPVLPNDFVQNKNRYKGKTFIWHIRPQQTGNKCYALPEWIGSLTMLEIRRSAMASLKFLFRNMYGFKYAIYINELYYKDCKSDEERNAKYNSLVKTVDDFFSGTENTGKAIYLKSFNDQLSKEQRKYITIEHIDDKTDYAAKAELISMTETSSSVNFGISPTLTGKQDKNQLPSGGEMFYNDNLQLGRRTPIDRRLILDFIWIIFDYYGWVQKYDIDEINILDSIITQLATEPSGITQ